MMSMTMPLTARALRHPIAGLLTLLATHGVIACGNGRVSTRDEEIQEQRFGTPQDYNLEDPDCQEGDGAATIGPQPIHTWNGERSVEEIYPFNISGGARSVSSSLISSTVYGYHERETQTCTVDADNAVTCGDSEYEVVAKGNLLKLCRPSGVYGRDSLEGSTLASIANLERARGVYSRLPGATMLQRAALFMMPKMEEVYEVTDTETGETGRSVDASTDNAAFLASRNSKGDDALYFIIYPRSEEEIAKVAKNGKQDIRLWEIPWVMAHEFSHQIFFTHYSHYHTDEDRNRLSAGASLGEAIKAQGEGEIWSPRPKVRRLPEQDRTYGAPSRALAGEAREVGTGLALAAVNEGFADFFGAQLLDGRQDQTRNLPCFVKTRDILSPTFADGSAKILTEEARNEFFSDTTIESRDERCGTSFQDTHHIGAVLAYGINEILMDGLPATAERSERAAAALSWLTTFDAARRAQGTDLSPEDAWLLAVKAALTVAQGPRELLLASQCDTAKTVFPLYKDRLFVDEGARDGFACAD